jgi:hypothetical protein
MLVRQEAIDCVRLVLCLASLYEGHVPDHDNDHASDLLQIRVKIQTEDADDLFRVTYELGKVRNYSIIANTDKPGSYISEEYDGTRSAVGKTKTLWKIGV